MPWCWYKTVKEFFEWPAKATWTEDMDCTTQIPTLNTALAHMRPFIYMLPWMSSWEILDTWSNVHEAEYNIYKIVWFYGKWPSKCIKTKRDECKWTCCVDYCSRWYGVISPMFEKQSWVPYVNSWEFMVTCPWEKQLKYNLPCDICDAYFIYYKYPEPLVDENSEIQIPSYLMPWLQMMLSYYNTLNWTYNADDAGRFSNDFISFIKQTQQVYKWTVPREFYVNLMP